MTGLLTRVMHERADASTPDVDLDAIISEGRRRVRRQRVTTGVVAAVLTGVVAAGATSVPLLMGGSHEPGPASTSFRNRAPTYALGSTIHVGDQVYDVGRPVGSLVQTDGGVVYTTPDRRVWHYDGATSVEIGRAEGHRLRSDDQGFLVAWVETADDGHPQYVVHSTLSRSAVARVDDDAAGPSLEPGDRGAEVFAVDDGSVYWRRDDGLVRYDVPSGKESVMTDADLAGIGEIVDVAYGNIAYTVDGSRAPGGRWGVAVTQRPLPDATPLAEASTGDLSPNGRLLAAEEQGRLAIYATADGQDVTPDVEGYRSVAAYDWVGDDVATVLALRDDTEHRATGDVLTCDVSDDVCSVVSTFRDAAPSAVVPASGDPIG